MTTELFDQISISDNFCLGELKKNDQSNNQAFTYIRIERNLDFLLRGNTFILLPDNLTEILISKKE